MHTAQNQPNSQAPAIQFEGRTFETETALHEWRLAFDFDYFINFSSQI
jgi:hypothetical protein